MKSICLGALTGGLVAATGVMAQPTALDTFGPGNSYESNIFLAVRGPLSAATPRNAHSTLFTAQAGGAVMQITTVLRHVAGQNDFTIQLRQGDANQVGPILGEWNVMAGPASSPIITIPVAGLVTLNAGQTYHIAAIGNGSSDSAWHQNNQNLFSSGWATSSNQGATFFFVNGTRLPAVRITLDGPAACYPNCDESTVPPVLNIDDFTCFINEFATGQALPPAQQVTHYANCDGSTTPPVLNIDDFTCFINAFAQGCP